VATTFGRRLAAVGAAVAVGGAAAVASAVPASAAVPGRQVVQVTGVFDSARSKSVEVFCPAGKRVAGAGFQLLGAQGEIVLDSLVPSVNSVRVTATEDQDGTNLNWKITAIAVCANPLPGQEIIFAQSGFGPGQSRSTSVSCPAGKRVLGTGVGTVNGAGQVQVNNLLLGDSTVYATGIADQDGYIGSWSLGVYAVCVNTLAGQGVVATNSGVDSNGTKVQSAECPGRRSYGIGWSIGGSGQVLVNYGGIGESGMTAVATEDDDGYLDNWAMGASTVCANI
jgi:hypothetical protein